MIDKITPVYCRSEQIKGAEVSWFAPICNGDFEYMGVWDDQLKSNWENASRILLKADKLGYRNILCPSSYQVGQDTWTFASAVAPLTRQINLLTAIRCGELHPPMLGRSIATLDHILKGRLTINIISSNMPGEQLPSKDRYQRSREVIEILKQGWNQDEINFHGQFYDLQLKSDPVKPYQQNGGPLLYFGGYSEEGKKLCAEQCDVYLMWPETEERLHAQMMDLSKMAAANDRKIDFGLRMHVIVRESESEARSAAARLMSRLPDRYGEVIRNRALDAKSLGVSKQTEMRNLSDSEGFIEDHLWTGIGRARSGCGAALVGNPDQIIHQIQRYMTMGIRSFIFSGYPHYEECELFARYVLPAIPTISMPVLQNRIPAAVPSSPLGLAKRK
ncbi:MAG: LLM class flavin-dependent oxidoreductase [Bacteroidia bacterium]|nr:LLM class flavin-dependent oxidoreductase [Bacteroidia bacterium]